MRLQTIGLQPLFLFQRKALGQLAEAFKEVIAHAGLGCRHIRQENHIVYIIHFNQLIDGMPVILPIIDPHFSYF